ncbi:hypothetical protein HMPREF1981_03609 [Bacteroides pyogenes F0041]|uniref:Uncharacterized protein n=1 Tax=Bacteroides pyogenes F0041 TaxID=1321819 RepID=U2C8G2_9BACE|nr:hypothetical protein HMPREF1981_03609 [Bacteroides pyogenes F0041]
MKFDFRLMRIIYYSKPPIFKNLSPFVNRKTYIGNALFLNMG